MKIFLFFVFYFFKPYNFITFVQIKNIEHDREIKTI